MSAQAYAVAQLPLEPGAEGERSAWTPLRRNLAVEAFGINAWTATADGQEVIGEHDEAGLGHEELYVARYREFAQTDPDFEPIRADGRFAALAGAAR